MSSAPDAASMQLAFEEASARLRKLEILQDELSANVYKNAVRMVKKGPSKLAEWHKSHVLTMLRELRKKCRDCHVEGLQVLLENYIQEHGGRR